MLLTDRIVNTIGGFSTALGNACKCDPWAVEIFAEEVVRGGPAFAISLVISGVEPRLRQLAELGAWQVGSAACATTVVCWQAVLHLCGPGMLTGGHQICEKNWLGWWHIVPLLRKSKVSILCVLRVALRRAGDQPPPGDGHR